jgi:hypothetical protein
MAANYYSRLHPLQKTAGPGQHQSALTHKKVDTYHAGLGPI